MLVKYDFDDLGRQEAGRNHFITVLATLLHRKEALDEYIPRKLVEVSVLPRALEVDTIMLQ